jgi:hypothetical protein
MRCHVFSVIEASKKSYTSMKTIIKLTRQSVWIISTNSIDRKKLSMH